MTRTEQIEELVSRTCDEGGGTSVTNCIAHLGRKIDERPSDCRLCATDMANFIRRAIAINGWLNGWKDEAEKLLRCLAKEGSPDAHPHE